VEDPLWRLVERRLERALPTSLASFALGDLAEDYECRLSEVGRLRAAFWLVREALSLERAHRKAFQEGRRRSLFVLRSELRLALRRLRSRPMFALACAILLGIGVGVCTAAFSAVDAVLLRPAPFFEADRLIQQTFWYAELDLMEAWRHTGMLESVEAGRTTTARIQTDTIDEVWPGAELTSGVFGMLGVRPVTGRGFGSTLTTGVASEVILSEEIWRRTFGSDPNLLGSRLQLNGKSVIVVGIMPAEFRFPQSGTVVWSLFKPQPRERGPFTIFGRLVRGLTRADAEGRLKELAQQLAQLPRNYAGAPAVGAVGAPNLGNFTEQALWLLMGGAAFVFVVLCANVSSLVLAGMSMRRREFGMCTALGASRGRLIREAAAEHAIVGIVGAALGGWIAWGLIAIVPSVFKSHTLNLVDIDLRALIAGSALGGLSVVLSGLLPVWLGTRGQLIYAASGSREAATETPAARFAAKALIVAEVSLVCSLLVGSALLVRSFAKLVYQDRGMDSDGVTRISVSNLDDAFGSPDAMSLATEAIEQRFANWAPIEALALSREVPPDSWRNGLAHLGVPGILPDAGSAVAADSYRISSSFFEVYQIPLLIGRTFRARDPLDEVIVSQRLAQQLWPGLNPLERAVTFGAWRTPRRVIGVAGDIRLPTLDPNLDIPELYVPLGTESRTLYLNIRCHARCPGEITIQDQIRAVHPLLRARVEAAAENTYSEQLQVPRAAAEVGGMFSIVALITAAAGLFSVLTFSVGRRRREFGIRAALGATPSQVRWLVFRDGLSVVGMGVAVGTVGGWVVGRSLAAFQYGVASTDPVAWASVLATVAFTALIAVWYPARLAQSTNPSMLLREL
jgi:predicted permease